MYEQIIELTTIDKANKFHKGIINVDCDVDLVTQNFRYTIDAKSIMGIFSLDLTKPVILKAHTDDPTQVKQIKNLLETIGC